MSQQPENHLVASGRFQLERDGHIAFLEYTLGDGVLKLIHTEVPGELRGGGIGSEIVRGALDYARENHLKVAVICPFVAAYLRRHPDYSDLLMK